MKLQGYKIELYPVEKSHLEMLRQWRNDPNISQFMLSQQLITKEQQVDWYKSVASDNTQQHWVIYFRDKAIGSANLKSLDDLPLEHSSEIEPGLYIADSSLRGNIIAFAPSLVLLDYCFTQLGQKQVTAHVKSGNEAALNYNKQLGYIEVQLGDLVEIQLNVDDYQAATTQIKSLLSR